MGGWGRWGGRGADIPQSGPPSRLPTGPLRVEGAPLLESLSKGSLQRPAPSPPQHSRCQMKSGSF